MLTARGAADPVDQPRRCRARRAVFAAGRDRFCLGAVAAAVSRASRCSTRSRTCRWCCRRFWSVISCCWGSACRGPMGAWLKSTLRHPARVHRGGRSGRDGGDGVSADGARDPAVVRGDGSRAVRGGVRAARRAVGPVLVDGAAARLAGRAGGRGDGVRRGPWRVRRGHHLRLQRRGRDADPAARDQCGAQHAGRRRRRLPAGADLADGAAIVGLVLAEMLQRWARRRLEA